MAIVSAIQTAVSEQIRTLYAVEATTESIQVNETKPEFEGDYTVVLFALVKSLRKAPELIGKELGEALKSSRPDLVLSYNVIKGFLNLSLKDDYWINFLKDNFKSESIGKTSAKGQKLMVEYSSPNTNKPLHLGHLRNIFLGWSIAEIFRTNGWDVVKTCIVNDRGIHICKSMLAWKKFGNGETPQSTGIKGDHLVGDFYVKFENELRKEVSPILDEVMAGNLLRIAEEDQQKLKLFIEKLKNEKLNEEKTAELKGEINDIARNNTSLMKEVRAMLLKWEEGDPETVALWKKMNGWVYEGFDVTYKKVGADFDKIYYESDTYLLGKQFVEQGLNSGVFNRKPDGSVWIDLTSDGLDEKLLLRRDGTSVYITQDLGLAKKKYDDYKMNESIYVVGDEQNYHFKVLKLIAQKLKIPNADNIFHLNYGMVDLPTGRMKSREGTVVDADDLIAEMESVSAKHTQELGKVKDFSETELQDLYSTLGLGALKFYLLRVDPKKRMVFNPEESVDFHGFTGPFIQYTYARISSILRKDAPKGTSIGNDLLPLEKQLLIDLERYPSIIEQAAGEMNPGVIANYVYHLAKLFNSFYTEHRVVNAESEEKKELRLSICQLSANVIKSGMGLLGIVVPDRM